MSLWKFLSSLVSASGIPILSVRLGSDHPFVATVDRHLRARGLGEGRAAHRGCQLGNVLAGDLRAEDVLRSVLLGREPVLLRAGADHLVGPNPRVEDGVRMYDVDANSCRSPFQGSDP